MKKILLLLSFLIGNANLSYCQISYQKTYTAALKKATELKQPVFINITPPATPNFPAFKSALDNEDVTTFYNKNFISYTVNVRDTAAAKFLRQYKLNTFPAYLFMDHQGAIIYKKAKSSTFPKFYLDMANETIQRLSTGKVLSKFEDKYKNGKITVDSLKEYILLKEELGMFDNAQLIDEYVDYLTIGAFKDFQVVLFVLKAGPYAYGKAYKLAYTYPKITDSIYKTLPLQERKEMNNRIINNTQNEAIRTKNLALAQSAMSYVNNTWGSDYREANKQSGLKLLSYYQAVKDTANYLSQAQHFYDTHYMTLSADSILKMEARRIKTVNPMPKPGISRTNLEKKNPTIVSQSVKIIRSDNVANTLNNAAYSFYTTGTKNGNYLTKALLWSKRSIELNPIPAYYDTLAHILYSLGFHEEALVTQNKAVAMASKQRRSMEIEHLKSEAKKIKDHKL